MRNQVIYSGKKDYWELTLLQGKPEFLIHLERTNPEKNMTPTIDIQLGQPAHSFVFSVPTPHHCVVEMGHLSAK